MRENLSQDQEICSYIEKLEPGLRRILAPNPSPMTYKGTNTYLLGVREIGVIDPGPNNRMHFNQIIKAIEPQQRITHIFVTHSHLDHSPLAKILSEHTKAEIYAFGPSNDGQSAVMRSLVKQGYTGGGEGVDADFEPHRKIREGEVISADDWELGVVETPGHFSNHLSFIWDDAVFTGDHIMDWASSMVSPPDGDLSDFMTSCRKLLRQEWRIFYPGHGDPVHNPKERTQWLIHHRQQRELQIIEALRLGPQTPSSLAQHIYTDTPKELLGAAARNVFAHLIDLRQREVVTTDLPFGFHSVFQIK